MKKLISSVFLVAGTSIGGGMVMLPAVVGVYGYFSAISMLVAVWFFNTVIALIFLEANCYLPIRTNLISMTKKLIGPHFELITWIICLSFMYTILCVYIAGMTEIIGGFLEQNSYTIPSGYLSLFSVIAVGLPIYFGMTYVSHFNRFIVMSMFLAFFSLVFLIVPHIDVDILLNTSNSIPIMSLPIVFTSFGFLIVIPSLRAYLNDDIKKIKLAIIIGSLIPLMIYIIWVTVIMGAIPALGSDSLQMILEQIEPVKQMSNTLSSHAVSPSISFFMQLFILFAIVSSFVGISLGLYDFLADGLCISRNSRGNIKLIIFTFLPPLIIELTKNRLFFTALGFAGLISTILFGLYPIMLTWSARYDRKLSTQYQISANKVVFLLMGMFCITIIGVELLTLQLPFLRS